MCVRFTHIVEEYRRKNLRTKLKIAAVVCNSVDFTSKVIMMDNFFVFKAFLTNDTSFTLINHSHPFFIRYYEASMLLFSLGIRFGVLSGPSKHLFDAFLIFKTVIITSTSFINSTKTYCAKFLSFFVQGIAILMILAAGVMLKVRALLAFGKSPFLLLRAFRTLATVGAGCPCTC